MFNLVKNEIIKIVKKRGFSFLLLLFIFLPIVAVVIEKYEMDSSYSSDVTINIHTIKQQNIEDEISNYQYAVNNENKIIDREYYLNDSTDLEYYTYEKQLEYGWRQTEYETNYDYRNTIYCYVEANLDGDTETYNQCKKKFDDMFNELVNNSYSYFVNKTIADLEKNKSEIEKQISNSKSSSEIKDLQEQLASINDDLEKYNYEVTLVSDFSTKEDYTYNLLILDYVTARDKFNSYSSTDKRSNEEEHEYLDAKAEYYKYKYMLDNKFLGNRYYAYNVDGSVDKSLIYGYASDSLSYYITDTSLWVIIFLIIFIGKIVGSEFEKGTIKQLLCRPYTRHQILASKIITAVLILFGLIAIHSVVQISEYGILCGFDTFKDQLIYDFTSNSVIQMNFFKYMFICTLGTLPKYLIILAFIFLTGTLFKSTLFSSIIPFILLIIPDFMDYYVQYSSYVRNIAIYTPFYTWNWNDFFFGAMSSSTYETGIRPLIVSIFWMLLIFALSHVAFKRAEIKNQ